MLAISESKLKSLLQDFYKLTKIKICIFDDEGQEVAYYPERLCAFCTYVRTSPAVEQTCLASDRRAFEICRQSGQTTVYTCHMGLVECVSPILCNGNCIGFVMLGQTAGSSHPDFERIRTAIAGYGLDVDAAKRLYDRVRYSSPQKTRAAVSVMEACAGYLYYKKLIVKREDLSVRLADYVAAHLSDDLSVDRLCGVLHLSRVELYEFFRARFALAPAAYVKKRRLAAACDLLSETDRPIADVAEACGFADYNYFSKVFKRALGQSPRAYRAAARQ